MEPSLDYERDPLPGVLQVSLGRDGEQRMKIELVLQPTVVTGQQFESDQVPYARHWDAELWPDLKTVRAGHDLVFYP